MSLLKNLTSDDSIANERDSVGSSEPLESGLYPATVKLAYVTKATQGALGLVLQLATEAGREIRETLWMTSGTAKGGNNYYERDGERHYLPGYINANALALLTVGKEISELDTETKVVSVYNKELKAEAPTKVEVPMDLIGQEILVGLIKETVTKNVKNDDGMYVPTDEIRNQNVIDKLFRASDKKTTAEIRAQAEEASFYETWCDKWNGKTRDRTSKQASGGTSASKPAATKKPTTSLFG